MRAVVALVAMMALVAVQWRAFDRSFGTGLEVANSTMANNTAEVLTTVSVLQSSVSWIVAAVLIVVAMTAVVRNT
jgi:small-conductance mechanosensitive channel